MTKEFLLGKDLSYNVKLGRPAIQDPYPNSSDLEFMQIDCDYTVEKQLKNGEELEVPVIRLYGVNQEGNSIAVFIYNFQPYFYAEIETSHTLDSEMEREQLIKKLNDAC